VREIRLLRSMSGVWKRSYGRPTKAPPDERGGNRHGRPKTTAPHPDSTEPPRSGEGSGRSGIGATSPLPCVPAKVPFNIRFADFRYRAVQSGGLLA